jgi:hypothetical protein
MDVYDFYRSNVMILKRQKKIEIKSDLLAITILIKMEKAHSLS